MPDPRLPALGVYIIPKHIYEKVSADDMPNYTAEDKIGGGPFMLGEVSKEFTRLVRNPNWFGKKPAMDEVIFRFYADQNAEFQALKSGEIDVLGRCSRTVVCQHREQRHDRGDRRQPGWFQ